MKPLQISRNLPDYIPMDLELRGRRDKEIIRNRHLRQSPDVSTMKRIVDPDGTVWGFCSPAQAQRFVKHRKSFEKKTGHFLSGREILESLYS
jgi:hypothetical protein